MLEDINNVAKIANELAKDAIVNLEAVGKGRNNRLFKVTTAENSYALKFHLHLPHDPRDRQDTEITALRFLRDNGIKEVPRVFAVDRDNGCSLMEWVDGETVAEPGKSDIDAVIALIKRLHALGATPEAARLPTASAACLSAGMLEMQIRQRLDRLEAGNGDSRHTDLDLFIREEFSPLLENITANAKKRYFKAGLDFNSEIPEICRVLSPSDFGFHNCLRRSDNELIFLDFEYFGWDDPVKMACDFLHHPGMNIASYPKIRERFINGVKEIFSSDPTLTFRFQQLYPLYGLCWCMIVLNEFTPDGWQRRELAAGMASDKLTVLKRQLEKARELLRSLDEEQLAP